jgi:fructose-1-phosphate kinase PfkB-like protein
MTLLEEVEQWIANCKTIIANGGTAPGLDLERVERIVEELKRHQPKKRGRPRKVR